MADLFVIAYEDEFKAEEVRLTLAKLQQEHLIELEDAAVVVKNKDGQIKLKQAVNLTAAGAGKWQFLGVINRNALFIPFIRAVLGACRWRFGRCFK
jgi:uncharacterized membrane protein